MGFISQRSMRRLTRRLWGMIFTLIIAAAVMVQMGREAFPLLNDYRDDISQAIGKRLGVHITVGQLSAKWQGLRPQIELHDVTVTSSDGEPVFDIEQVIAELSLVDSLRHAKLSWRRLAFHQLHTTLRQNDAGHWQVKNLQTRARTPGRFTIEDPMDIFLFGRRVELDNATFNLEFRTGHASVLSIPRITLENDRDFHRATASVGVLDSGEDKQEHFKLVMEATGDPRDPEHFTSNGYLSLERFPMEKVVAAFAGSHWQQPDELRWGEGHRLDLQLWFDGSSRKGMRLTGKLRADGLPLNVPESVLLPEGVSADITGAWHPKEGWDIVLQQLVAHWPEFQSPTLNVKLSGGIGQPFRVGIDTLKLEPWRDLSKKVGVIPSSARKILNKLDPQGQLDNIDITLTSAREGYFRLKADVKDAQVNAFAGSPAISGLNGYVEASAIDGFVDIDSPDRFQMHFPRVYKKALDYDRARGRVAWRIDLERGWAFVSSGRLQLQQGDEVANGYLRLKLPTHHDGREPQMTLAVGVAEAPVSLHRKYVPKLVPKSLYAWLGRSIGEGTASNIGFIFHGSLSRHAEVRPNIQLVADVRNGDLAFDPQWPALKNISGHLVLDDRSLDVQISQATLLNNRVNNAEVQLVNNPEDEGMALAIIGHLNSNAAAAMDLLQQSPVRNLFGSTFDSWRFGGDVSAHIALMVPLSTDAEGLRQSVDVVFHDARVDMQDINLSIERVEGKLHYDSDNGLAAEKLKGRVWDKPLTATIHSPESAAGVGRDTIIAFSGPVDVADLRHWTNRPELGFAAGKAKVEGTLTIPAKGTQPHFLMVDMTSQLQGVAFDLPQPLHKEAAAKELFKLNLRLFQGKQEYQFEFGDNIQLRLLTGDQIESSGQLNLGMETLPLQAGYFDVVGAVQDFDLMVWDDVRKRYFEYLEADRADEASTTQDDLPIRLNLDIGRAVFEDAQVEQVHVDGLGTQREWDLRVASKLAAGDIRVAGSEDNLDLSLNLDYLRLETGGGDPESQAVGPEEATGETSPGWKMASIDLSKLSFPVKFAVQDLSIDGKPYGRWAFDLSPLATGDGISLSNIHANIRGMAIGEAAREEPVVAPETKSAAAQPRRESSAKSVVEDTVAYTKPQAEFIWRQTQAGNESYFKGTLMARDIGEVLHAWGFEKVLDSRVGLVTAEVSWPGAPDEITLPKVSGQVMFNLEDGNFIRGAADADTGLLRLIALFNFDTIVRRLQLDFSDLAKEGFGFESVRGEFDFKDGEIFINQPLVVDSTSSKIQVAGTLDVIDEKIDAELVATLPVAGDITVAAALVAGLPAAVGVFLVSKMFEEQVDRASSITYGISGDWDDPKIKFRKIFSDTGAAEKGQEASERARTITAEDLEGVDFSDSPPPTPVPE